MTNSLAFCFMSINLTFYLWANDLISTGAISTLITFFQTAFPLEEPDGEEEEDFEKQLDVDECSKTEIQAKYKQQ